MSKAVIQIVETTDLFASKSDGQITTKVVELKYLSIKLNHFYKTSEGRGASTHQFAEKVNAAKSNTE